MPNRSLASIFPSGATYNTSDCPAFIPFGELQTCAPFWSYDSRIVAVGATDTRRVWPLPIDPTSMRELSVAMATLCIDEPD